MIRRREILYSITIALFIWTSCYVESVSCANREAYGGNTQRNVLQRQLSEQSIDIVSIRGEGTGEGRSIKLSFATEGFPWFRVRRWNNVDQIESTSSDLGVNFRFGIVSIIEYVESSGQTGFDASDEVVNVVQLTSTTRLFGPLLESRTPANSFEEFLIAL